MHAQYKTKRTRTGCLTCRDRHLKCDEEAPDCFNCRKSRRVCNRGRRINFAHYLDVKPLQYTAKGEVRGGIYRFRDESRSIADQYEGGRDLYPPIDEDLVNDDDESIASASHGDTTTESQSSLSSPNQCSDVIEPSPARTSTGSVPQYTPRSMHFTFCALDGKYPGPPGGTTYPSFEATTNSSYDVCGHSQQLTPVDTQSTEDLYIAACNADVASLSGFESYAHSGDLASRFYPSPVLSKVTSSNKSLGFDDRHEGLADLEQAQHLKACIDRIAPWLNAFDHDNHFERTIAHRAVRCPTLLGALLAYEAAPSDELKARCHYYAASHRIKDIWEGYKMIGFIDNDYNLTDTTAALIVLYAYRVTTGVCHRGTSYISEAMEMLQLGQRDASSPGLGGACFWLFVVTDVMACLRMNRPVTLKPEAWGVDMTMDTNLTNGSLGDGDEIWVHRIFYVMAKACDFRARAPRIDINDPLQRLGERQPDWRQLETLCLEWDRAIPGTMRPFAYVNKRSPDLRSCFPLIHFSTAAGTLGRLFYHMTLCILAQTNPRELLEPIETRARGRHHAQQICGIVATASSGPRSCLSTEMVSCSLGIADLAIDNMDERSELARMMLSNHSASRVR